MDSSTVEPDWGQVNCDPPGANLLQIPIEPGKRTLLGIG
jgi:hypothetical protein